MARNKLALIALIGLLMVIAACQPPQPTPTPFPTFTPAPTATITPTPTPVRVAVSTTVDPAIRANVSFLLAVPGAPTVDVYIESSLGAARLAYGRLTSPFALAPDRYTVRVVPVGETAQSDRALLSEIVEFAPSESVIVVFIGTPDAWRLVRYAQDTSPLAGGAARVTVANVLADGSAIGLAIGGDSLGELQNGGPTTSPRSFKPGRSRIAITSGGNTLLEESLTLQDRATHLIVVYGGQPGEKPALAIAIAPTRREARLRVIHAMRDLGPVDVFLNDQPIAQNLDYRGATEWRAFGAATYPVRVQALNAPAGQATVFSGQITLNPDLTANLVLYAVAPTNPNTSEPVARAQLFAEDLRPTPLNRARLSVLNAAQIDTHVQVMNPSQPLAGFTQINYGAISSGVNLSPGPRDLAINAAGAETARTIETAAGLEFQAGKAYLYVVLGDPSAFRPLILETEVGIEGGGATPTPENVIYVRLVNTLSGVESIDLYIGDTPIIRDVKYGAGSDVISIARDLRPLSIRQTGGGGPLASLQMAAAPEGQLLFVAMGSAENPQLLQSAEPVRAPVGFALLHLIHAAPDGPQLSLDSPRQPPSRPSSTGPTPTPGRTVHLRLAKYGDISQIVRLRQGAYTFVVRDVQTGEALGQLEGVNVELRKRYVLLVLPEGDTIRLSLIATDDAQ